MVLSGHVAEILLDFEIGNPAPLFTYVTGGGYFKSMNDMLLKKMQILKIHCDLH